MPLSGKSNASCLIVHADDNLSGTYRLVTAMAMPTG